jgi:hypothetical protein
MTELEVLQSFRRNANGSWTPLKTVTIGGITVGPGVAFTPGVAFSGLDLAALLNQLAAKYSWAVQT